MKVMTIFGTRPEIIRLSLVMRVLDQHCEHVKVHTGQNFHESLSGIFLNELGVGTPEVELGIKAASFGEQAGKILSGVDEELERPIIVDGPSRRSHREANGSRRYGRKSVIAHWASA